VPVRCLRLRSTRKKRIGRISTLRERVDLLTASTSTKGLMMTDGTDDNNLDRRIEELAARFAAQLAGMIREALAGMAPKAKCDSLSGMEAKAASLSEPIIFPPIPIAAYDWRARIEYVAQTQDILNQDIRIACEKAHGAHGYVDADVHDRAFRAAWTTRKLSQAARAIKGGGRVVSFNPRLIDKDNGTK
jgi:glycerol-3-phosphate dehydrogenase